MKKSLLTAALSTGVLSLGAIVEAAHVDQNPRGIRRVTGDSLTGRRMTQSKGAHVVTDDPHIPKEIRDHNAAIDAKRAAKKAKKHGSQ